MKTRLLVVLCVLALAHAQRGARADDAARTTGVEARLNRIILPEVALQGASITDAVALLSQEAAAHDPTRRGIDFTYKPGTATTKDGQPPLVTFHARHISLLQALRIVTRLAGLKFHVEGDIVMLEPLNAPDADIVVRTYDVTPAIADRIRAVNEDVEHAKR